MLTFERDKGLKSDQVQGTHEWLALQRVLFLYGPIFGFPSRLDGFNPHYVADNLLALSRLSKDPVWLIIDSEGGSVRDGLVLYDAIKLSGCPVYTVGRMCYSMAAIILAAGVPGHRYVYPHGQTMLHLPAGMAAGDEAEVKIRSREITKVKELLVKLLLDDGVHRTRQQILKDIDREFWMTAEETVDYGLADHILTSKDTLFLASLKKDVPSL